MSLTEKDILEFLKDPNHCPWCHEADLRMLTGLLPVNSSNRQHYQQWRCNSCGQAWKNTYTLVSMQEIEYEVDEEEDEEEDTECYACNAQRQYNCMVKGCGVQCCDDHSVVCDQCEEVVCIDCSNRCECGVSVCDPCWDEHLNTDTHIAAVKIKA